MFGLSRKDSLSIDLAFKLRIGLLALVAFVLSSTLARAEMAIPVPAEQLMGLSDRVFYGKVIDKQLNFGDCGHIVTDVTFEVITPIRGDIVAKDTVLVTRFGADGRDVPEEFSAMASKVHGPSWEDGKNYVVFLGPEGECGYNNSVGIGAGVFKEGVDENGEATLLNAAENRQLFASGRDRMSKALVMNPQENKVLNTEKGPMNRDALISVLSKLSSSTGLQK